MSGSKFPGGTEHRTVTLPRSLLPQISASPGPIIHTFTATPCTRFLQLITSLYVAPRSQARGDVEILQPPASCLSSYSRGGLHLTRSSACPSGTCSPTLPAPIPPFPGLFPTLRKHPVSPSLASYSSGHHSTSQLPSTRKPSKESSPPSLPRILLSFCHRHSLERVLAKVTVFLGHSLNVSQPQQHET